MGFDDIADPRITLIPADDTDSSGAFCAGIISHI
jgi:hypothetical protein